MHSGINVSPPNKNLLTILLILYLENKIPPNSRILLEIVFNPNLLNNLLASCSLTNLEFLPSLQ